MAFQPDARKFGLQAPRGVLLLGCRAAASRWRPRWPRPARRPAPAPRSARVLGTARGPRRTWRGPGAAEANAPLALWVDEIEKAFAGSAPGRAATPARRGCSAPSPPGSRSGAARSSWWPPPTTSPGCRPSSSAGPLRRALLRRSARREARRSILAVHLRRRGRDPAAYDLRRWRSSAPTSPARSWSRSWWAASPGFRPEARPRPQDLRRVAQDLVPLYKTYEESIKALREWARGRARTAGERARWWILFRRTSG